MKVTLINYTQEALALLLFTKSTRLQMSPAGLDEVRSWPQEKVDAELKRLQGTIKSSWEFVDYVFLIEGVSRAFTHQFVRHRVGTSFAQQSQRAVDMSGFEYVTGPSIADNGMRQALYDEGMHRIDEYYNMLITEGADAQDARGLLPTNICTNIVFKGNLRTMHQMISDRLCVRTQGEFQDVVFAMRQAIVAVHPWTETMLRVHCAMTGVCLYDHLPATDCPIKPSTLNMETGCAHHGGFVAAREKLWDLWQENRTALQPQLVKKEQAK